MNQARIDAQAWNDVAEIAEFLGEVRKNPEAARTLIDEFERKASTYARQPEMGDLRDEIPGDLRSFLFRKWYIAIYRPISDGIDILRVFDARSDFLRHLRVN